MNKGSIFCVTLLLQAWATSGCIKQKCSTDSDCPSPKVCAADGTCELECSDQAACGDAFECIENRCVPKGNPDIKCPSDMVVVANAFCIDTYEASRPDASNQSAGADGSVAVSAPGVMPWAVGDDNSTADEACKAAGKRLCTAQEWQLACQGPDSTRYGYGDVYSPTTCNGIDTFGRKGLKLMPTASFDGCVNGWGAHDMNGNLWEHVAEGDGKAVRGGAFNCLDSMTYHRCDYVPRTWVPAAIGFRCCLTPDNAGPIPDALSEDSNNPADVADASDSGCLDPDLKDGGELQDQEVLQPQCLVSQDCMTLFPALDECQVAVCSALGTCEVKDASNGTACSDNNPCTVGDSCIAGECVPGTETLQCPAPPQCMNSQCVAGDGCQNVPADGPCEDGNLCTTGDFCQQGACAAGTNTCECQTDTDCPVDEDMCNGVLFCNVEIFPSACEVVPNSAITCESSSKECIALTCDPLDGECKEQNLPDGTQCNDGDPCTGPDTCSSGLCSGGNAVTCACADGMLPVNDQFCMDIYEASRPDATALSQGTDTSMATSRQGVLPWFPIDINVAGPACSAAGKRLCTVDELNLACGGLEGTKYVYGDTYSATKCNGIDAFCNCSASSCSALEECPYPHCYNQTPDGASGGCGSSFHVETTGSFPDCINEWGIMDVNGNVWELVDKGNGESWWTGGAFNCGNSEFLHTCGGLQQSISAKGFRCCSDLPGAKKQQKAK